MMKLRPLHDFVLVKRSSSESVTEGGIVIPETAQLKSRKGEVLAVGPGQLRKNGLVVPIVVKPGDVVYFRGVSGQEIDLAGEEYLMLRESEIEAVE